MNPIVLRCPNCNGEIKLDADREYGFCEYCGTKIFMNTVQEIKGTINVNRQPEIENLIARAREFERAGDFYQAESYYNRVLDIDVNDSRAKEGCQRVRSIVTEPNVFISRIPSNHDPAVKLVVKQNGVVLGKISRGAGMALMLPVGVHTLQLNLGDSKKQVTFRISTRHDRVNITSRSKMFGHEVTCDNPYMNPTQNKKKTGKRWIIPVSIVAFIALIAIFGETEEMPAEPTPGKPTPSPSAIISTPSPSPSVSPTPYETPDATIAPTESPVEMPATVLGEIVNVNEFVNVRAEPSTDSDIVMQAAKGAQVEILETTDGWHKINIDGDAGYVSADYIKILEESGGESSEFNLPFISKAEFEAIEMGMTYDEVVEIIGGEGELASEVDVGYEEFRTLTYVWIGEGLPGANAIIQIQGGKVITKSQAGLW